MREQRRRRAVLKFLTYIFVISMTLILLFPLYMMVVAATIPQEALLSKPVNLLPGGQFMNNFRGIDDLTGDLNYLRTIWNSVFVATVYTLLSLLLCSMAGFAFAKYDFRFKKALFYFILATLILPIQILVIPLFLLMVQIGWTDTFIALILPWAANPIGIFLMRQNMQSIPDALLESARMDGASEFQIFYRIVLPTMRSSLAALAIILFLFQWDLFLYPLVVLTDQSKFTIPLGLSQMTGVQRVNYSQVMVGATLAIAPLALLFIVLQRQFVSGILAGSLKE